MATVVGVACVDGALLAGDRVRTTDGRVATRSARHVHDLDGVGLAAVGGDPDRLAEAVAADLRRYRLERGDPGLAAVVRVVADRLDPDAAAVVAARGEGDPGVRAVDADGVLPADPVAARGSGAAYLLGGLGFETPPTLDTAAAAVADAFEAAADRDPGTGAEIELYRLS